MFFIDCYILFEAHLMYQMHDFYLIYFILILKVLYVKTHGYMIVPAQRGSLWRAGFETTVNYNDMSIINQISFYAKLFFLNII